MLTDSEFTEAHLDISSGNAVGMPCKGFLMAGPLTPERKPYTQGNMFSASMVVAGAALWLSQPPTQAHGVRPMPAPLDPPVTCPKYGWAFPFGCEGWAKLEAEEPQLRFMIFVQSIADMPLAQQACRFLLTLYNLTYRRLRLDHALAYDRLIHVFLCVGGKAGGEQGVFEGRYKGLTRKLNSIYIYDLDSFEANAVEMLRELAHEYGHAVLPNVGGFQTPEEWGNGFLGERLFLLWCSEEAAKGYLRREDMIGADPAALIEWVARTVLPKTDNVWLNGVNQAKLEGTGPSALDEYTGLVTYAWEAFPGALGRALKLAGGDRAKHFLEGLVRALHETAEWHVRIPDRLKGKDVWVPMQGGWTVSGGRTVERRGGWMRIRSPQGVFRATRGTKEGNPYTVAGLALAKTDRRTE